MQRGILATSQTEKPFDVFICYKESDENGERTRDSLLAQDIYYQLTDQGRRVFFSRITLEDKAGTEYEPYIFAALNSAKVMIVVGTKAEYLDAVWVKNEWSRFLALMKKDRSRLLIPCYRDMDPYDLPEQLSVLQSYDMSKIGFIQDLIRGVAKVLDAEKAPEPKRTVEAGVNANLKTMIKRGSLSLEEGEWEAARNFFDRALDIDAECAEAYVGLLMADLNVRTQNQLIYLSTPFEDNSNYKRALRFADERLKTTLEKCASASRKRIQREKKEAENARKDEIYNKAVGLANGDISRWVDAIKLFHSISGWRDADSQAEAVRQRIDETNREWDRKEQEAKSKAHRKKIACISICILALLGIVIFFVVMSR